MNELLQALRNICPVAYSHFNKPVELPYIAYIGSGQDSFGADDTWYHSKNRYQIEYYFRLKDESKERAIEDILLSFGYNYTKSEDVFNDDENVFLIYYGI